jgi:hypothetical protein
MMVYQVELKKALSFVHRPLKLNEELVKTQHFENWLWRRPQLMKNAKRCV